MYFAVVDGHFCINPERYTGSIIIMFRLSDAQLNKSYRLPGEQLVFTCDVISIRSCLSNNHQSFQPPWVWRCHQIYTSSIQFSYSFW